jgi:hypothetical protein
MIPIVLGIIGTVAAAAWIFAVVSAIQIVGLAPQGTRMRNYFRLGWWKFAEIRADAGAAIDPHVRNYRLAFFVFFACILGLAVVAMFLGFEQQNS